MFLRWYYRENRWVNLPKASTQGLLSEQGGDITTGAADELWRDRGRNLKDDWRRNFSPSGRVYREVPRGTYVGGV